VLPGERRLTFGWQKALHRTLHALGQLAPGLGLAVCLAVAGTYLSAWMGSAVFKMDRSSVSPILLTVLIGLLIRNVAGLPVAFEEGLRVCVRVILRVGVALLGLRLSLAAAGQIGLHALPLVFGCIAVGIASVLWLGKRLGLPPRLASLIAVGTGICGVSAIVATAPAIKAKDEEVSYSVSVIALFGMVAMCVYPFLAHLIFEGNPTLAGYFLGTAIHDTSQVAGAGLMYDQLYENPRALEVATTTKLLRNLCMGAVIPLMAWLHYRDKSVRPTDSSGKFKWSQLLPFFVLAFIALVGVRTAGDFYGLKNNETWKAFLTCASQTSVYCLTLAMGAVGLGASLSQMRQLGWRPLCLGFAAALLVGGVSVLLLNLLGRVIAFS
jgi:uncharacterized integral membrane protein (TIGR00698 family)